jgi:purine-binding chemotaxis protein CheW
MPDLLLIVTLAGQRVALDAASVEGVVEIEGITPVPRAAPHIAGLSALRSRVLTVIDCLASLELGCTASAHTHDAVVAVLDGHPYALLVDAVEDVVEHDGSILPLRTALGAGWRRIAAGSVDSGGDLLLLVDARSLIAGPLAAAA